MFCKNCGAEIQENQNTCSKCNVDINEENNRTIDNKKVIKISFNKFIVALILIISIAACVIIFIIKNKNKNENSVIEENNIIALDKNEDITIEADFISEIKAKYPTESESICTDGDNYWLLSADGDKVYFTDLESFEMAMEACFNIATEDKLKENFGKMVDKKTFLNNLTEENKNELATFIKTTPIKTDKKATVDIAKRNTEDNKKYIYPDNAITEYIEDRFIEKNNEIIYCLIYRKNSDLYSKIYVITPAKKVPEHLSEVNDLNEYFVINEWEAMYVHLGKSYGITNNDIEDAKKELNIKIEENIKRLETRKERFTTERSSPESIDFYEEKAYIAYYKEQRLEIALKYLNDCPVLPESKRPALTGVFCNELYPPDEGKNAEATWRINNFYCTNEGYCQIIDKDRILFVKTYYNELKPNSYGEEYYIEYFAAGVCVNIEDIPFLLDNFSGRQLVLTGYLPEYSEKTFVMTSVTRKEGDSFSFSELVKEQNSYIRSYFGL